MNEKNTLRAARRAQAAGKTLTAEQDALIRQADRDATERDPNRLGDPDHQLKVLNPTSTSYDLCIGDVMRKIVISNEFTMSDVHKRRVLDDMRSFLTLAVREAQRYDPDLDASGSLDGGWFQRNIGNLAIAMAKSVVREDARAIIAKIARFDEPFLQDGRQRVRPTSDEIAEGLSATDTDALSLFLIMRYLEEIAKPKNG